MNIEDLIKQAFPGWAVKREQARLVLRAYEAAQPSRSHKPMGDALDADSALFPAGESIRQQARWLDDNHDLASGALTSITNAVVGAQGIVADPQPRNKKGEVIQGLADDIRRVMEDAGRYPEVTGQMNDAQMQRQIFRAWLRDGEMFAQVLEGNVRGLRHLGELPLSLELLEADFVPYDVMGLTDDNLVMGIKKDAWGRPKSYYVYKDHPGKIDTWTTREDLKIIPARKMMHVMMRNRLGQTRGISQFAPVITRLNDLKLYEESERLAARISAALTVAIKKGSPDLYNPGDGSVDGEREFAMAPGMVFDQLMPGESVEVIESSRPNALLGDFRAAMVRMVAAGLGGTYSSIAKSYEGTYSSQRQELVEGYVAYRAMGDEYIAQFVRPLYERRLEWAQMSGLVRLPRELDKRTLMDAGYTTQQMPWIDPAKEAGAWETLAQAGFESEEAVIRSRGRKPQEVQAEIKRWREWSDQEELQFSSNIGDQVSQAAGSEDGNPDDAKYGKGPKDGKDSEDTGSDDSKDGNA